jgi:hypothetical protein
MKNKKYILRNHLLVALMALSLPITGFGEGNCEDCGNDDGNNNDGNPTPTPAPSATPSPSATPVSTPQPITSGPAADQTSIDNRYVTIELETEHPNYSKRNFAATDVTLNSLVSYNARQATFRGFYVGSNRGATPNANPASTGPITDPAHLTQAPTPSPAPAATATPAPGAKPTKVRKPKTAKQYSDDGNDQNGNEGHQSGGG